MSEDELVGYRYKAADVSNEHYDVLLDLQQKRRTVVKGSWKWLLLFFHEKSIVARRRISSIQLEYEIQLNLPDYELSAKRRSEGRMHVEVRSKIQQVRVPRSRVSLRL